MREKGEKKSCVYIYIYVIFLENAFVCFMHFIVALFCFVSFFNFDVYNVHVCLTVVFHFLYTVQILCGHGGTKNTRQNTHVYGHSDKPIYMYVNLYA